MNRRGFCAGLAGTALIAGMSSLIPHAARAAAAKSPDLVAVQGGDAVTRLTKALEAFGGIQSFVRPGQKVLIKPNMGWAVGPAGGANTDPLLMKRLTELCVHAGAAKVMCFDNPCDHWRDSYKESGIEEAVKDGGGQVAPPNSEGYYHAVRLAEGKILQEAKAHELYMEADVILNVPVLKHHGGAGLSCAMKNLMGVVWDRKFYHRSGLDQCIADFCTLPKKPTLNIVDAGRVMLSGGPRGQASSQFKRLDMLIASPDIVAADVASALAFGAKPADYAYIAMGAAQGVGKNTLDGLDVRRLRV